jgi:hypothetical protein
LGSGTTNLIGEVELTSSATQINFTDISQAYTDLLIVADLRTDRAAVATDEFYMRVGNGSIDSGTNYSYRRRFEGSSANTISSAAADHWEGGIVAAATAATSAFGQAQATIAGYSATDHHKNIVGRTHLTEDSVQYDSIYAGRWENTAAIDYLRFVPEAGTNFIAGSIVRLYGLPVEGSLVAGWSPILDYKPTTDTPDDEFDSTTLDAKWTAVSGSAGTVDFLELGNVTKYDLATRPGWLLLQAGADGTSRNIDLRQDFTLPDGASIVAAVSPSAVFADVSSGSPAYGISDGELNIGILLNGDDANPYTSTTTGYAYLLATEMDAGEIEVNFFVTNNTPTTQINSESILTPVGGIVYLRIVRSGTTYYGFYSVDGSSWVNMGSGDAGAAQTNLWITARNGAAMTDPIPIQAVDWIRQGTNNLDPWTHSGLIQLDTVPEWMTYLATRVQGETVNSNDDFFDDGFLDARWTTLTVTGAQTITEKYGLLSIQVTSNQGATDLNAVLRSVTPSVGDYIETRINSTQVNALGTNDFLMTGLVFSDGTASSSNCAVAMAHRDDSSGRWGWVVTSRDGTFTAATAGTISDVLNHSGPHLYMRWEYDATNTFRYFISPDGVSWYDLGTETATITPTHVGLVWSTWGDTADGQTVAYDYFRYN